MTSSADQRKQLVDLLRGRPGWRLEPRTTPGATPLWCFVENGEIEFSVTVDGRLLRLYVMENDQEVVFPDRNGLTVWLLSNRAHALQDRPVRPDGKTRVKRLFEWN